MKDLIVVIKQQITKDLLCYTHVSKLKI